MVLEALAAKYSAEIAVQAVTFPERAERLGVSVDDLPLLDRGRKDLASIAERVAATLAPHSAEKRKSKGL